MAVPTRINLIELLASHPPRTNFNVLKVDKDYSVRVAKVHGRFPWHFHPNGDEGWFVFQGCLRIDTEEGPVELGEGDFAVIDRGVRHSPEAMEPGTVVIIFNRRDLGMVLDDPEADLGGFQVHDGPS